MTAARRLAPVRRYDRVCAFCDATDPRGRLRGKAACAKCIAIAKEADASCEDEDGAMHVPWTRVRALVRYLLDIRRDYPEPLWRRALRARGSLRK